jgi:hypothetical protein
MLNYSSLAINRAWVEGDTNVTMETNKYFDDMHRLGYEIQVSQIVTVDVCSSSVQVVASCYTEDHTGIKALEHVKFSTGKKVILIYQLYAGLSVIDNAFSYFNGMVRKFAEQNGWYWPKWWSEGIGMPSIRAMHALSLLAEDVARSQSGQLFFTHLVVPHYPYIYDANCDERDPSAWEPAHEREPLPPNTAQSRARRYPLYFEQIQCLYKKLEAMFRRWQETGVFDRAVIIVHGDHGSRIYLHRPEAANRDEMLVADYADAFSTLLAVKAPGYEPGYDLRWIAIQDLLPDLAIQGRPRQMAPGQSDHPALGSEQLPYVFLEGGSPGRMLKQPLPNFGDASRGAHPRGTQ